MTKSAFLGSRAPVITGVTTKLAQSLNPLLNSKNKTMTMSEQAKIRMCVSKRLLPISHEDYLRNENNLNSFFDTLPQGL
jgi:hypothetical protein